MTLEASFPTDQAQKLAIIEHAAAVLLPLFDPLRRLDPPTDADDLAAMNKAADAFANTAANATGKGADDAQPSRRPYPPACRGPARDTRSGARRSVAEP